MRTVHKYALNGVTNQIDTYDRGSALVDGGAFVFHVYVEPER